MPKRPAPSSSDPRPAPDTTTPAPRGSRTKARNTPRSQPGEAHDEGPLEALGKAVSSPMIGTAQPDEDEKPE